MTNDQLWQAILGEIELNISKANFATWFKGTFISSIEEDQVIVGVPSGFVKTWMEGKFQKKIHFSIENILNKKIKNVIFKIENQKANYQKTLINPQSYTSPKINSISSNNISNPSNNYFGNSINKTTRLNPRYTLKNFINGNGNQLAYAASQAVISQPGKAYNPLFIYGGVGLGKTHLIQAIGNSLMEKTSKILYITSEQFANDYIQSLKSGKAKEFKNAYRNVDVLIVDDIQFLGGKDGTQQEFFHTFNELHQTDKQIVITSDRQPKALTGIEKRLLSRFEWGMIADIISPDLDTRIAILEAKCGEKNYFLERNIIHYLATTIQSNIRELEGALNKLIAIHEFNNSAPTIESTKNVLNSILVNFQSKSKTPKSIIDLVAKYFDINPKDITGKCRKKELVLPRQIIMYILREECGSSYPNIGEELGGRDHTTAMHAYNKIVKDLKENIKLKQDIDSIKQLMQDGAPLN